MPFKVWAVGEEVLAADFNDYLQEQVVATFPTIVARDASITAPQEGQMCYVVETRLLYMWNGTAWITTTALQGEAVKVDTQSGIAAAVIDIAGLAVQFTPRTGRAYRAEISGTCFNNNAATGTIGIYIADGANVVKASQFANSGAGIVANWPISFRTPKLTGLPAGVPMTLKGRANITAGVDLRISGAPTSPWLLTVSDVGPG